MLAKKLTTAKSYLKLKLFHRAFFPLQIIPSTSQFGLPV